MALYSFANGQIIPALRLLYRARYLALLICGDNHPDMALLDVSRTALEAMEAVILYLVSFYIFPQSNIALVLHAAGEFQHSLRFLEHALLLNLKYYGEKSLKVAVSFHLVARTQSCLGDFRSALNSEKETYAIYKQLVRVICFFTLFVLGIAREHEISGNRKNKMLIPTYPVLVSETRNYFMACSRSPMHIAR